MANRQTSLKLQSTYRIPIPLILSRGAAWTMRYDRQESTDLMIHHKFQKPMNSAWETDEPGSIMSENAFVDH